MILWRVGRVLHSANAGASLLSCFLPRLLRVFYEVLQVGRSIRFVGVRPYYLTSLAVLGGSILGKLRRGGRYSEAGLYAWIPSTVCYRSIVRVRVYLIVRSV